jgi:N-acetylglucosamine-6-phosphate deacetylase
VRLGVEAALVDGRLVAGDVEIEGDRIARVGVAGRGTGIAVPGFVDLHVHGFGGVDFASADAAAYRRAGEAMLATGVTAFQPTLVTAREEELVASLREVPRDDLRPRILGVHLEGPFLSPRRLGMHPGSARRDPDAALLRRLVDAGPVVHMTLAPELDGALDLVDALRAGGVVAACGATHVTHLFNAMRPFTHRDPGIAGAALVRDDVTVELILDGHHVSDEAALIAWRAAPGRVALVTDGMAATGAGDGTWQMGPVSVQVRDGVVRTLDGVLAGSVLTMRDAIRNAVRLGIPFAEAVDAATLVPARAARRTDVGRIGPGALADVVVLDGDVEVTRVLVGGVERG